MPMNRILTATIIITLLTSCSPRNNPKTLSQLDLSGLNLKRINFQVPPKLVRSDFAVNEVSKLCELAIQNTKLKLDAIAAIPANDRKFENTMLAYENVMADFMDEVYPLTFMGYVSTNEEISAEGSTCEEKVGQFGVEVGTRKDIYVALKDQAGRNENEKRLLSETLKSFESNGLMLSDEKLEQFKKLKTELATLESQFSTNLNGDNSSVELTEKELEGVPVDYISRLKKTADGKFIVTTRSSDYSVFLPNAKDSEARHKWLFAYFNRQADVNTKLLERAISLRSQIGKLMGYQTWADYRIHGRMATDGKTVLTFLNSLKDKLATKNAADLGQLLKMKQESDPSATKLEAWDINYFSNQLKKRDYDLDVEKIREYFPTEIVISGMFEVYSKLLSVNYTEIKDAQVWSPDVKLYKIEDKKSGQLLGFFYTDFIPRAGKYGHAAAFPLISGRMMSTGEYSYPVAAVVANLNPPADGKPSLLSHDDVETVFHEFGHIMHQTLTRAPFASLSGSSVAQDFVEAPSQMLENWVWDEQILKIISGHYLDHSKKLPPEILAKMLAAKDFNQGYFYTRQLLFALLDMNYHTSNEPVDSAAVFDSLSKQILGVDAMPGAHFAASFGHLMGGYDAGYYGYLWSEVYATDMFERFNKDGLLNSDTGSQYRSIILESGNMTDAIALLKSFLGREPNADAFYKKLKINN